MSKEIVLPTHYRLGLKIAESVTSLLIYIRYSNSVFTETKYMELPKTFFGYFVFLGYLVTMATAFLSNLG